MPLMIDMNKYDQGMVAVCEGCAAYHCFVERNKGNAGTL